MVLSTSLTEYIRACFTGIWVESHEHEDAIAEIAQLCRDNRWRLASWDIDGGLRVEGEADNAGDPLAAIRSLRAISTPDGTTILVLYNFHRFLQSAEIVQALARQVVLGKQNRTFVIILSPVVQIPTELEKLFVVVEHDLPERPQIEEIARGVATEEGELPSGDQLDRVLDAAGGLTRYEAENAFSLSLVRHGRVAAETVWQLKSQMLKKSGLLSLHRGGEDFADLGGLDALKDFCLRSLRNQGQLDPLKRPRGVLLLSPPGCGKSQFCKALGNEVGRPTLMLDVGSLLGSLVGQSEERTRQALRIIDAMAPCVVMVDEIEKAFGGVTSGMQGDSGVSTRMFGTFLTWLSDHESDVYVVATSNDISKLPPELSRAERWDGVVFIDFPTEQEKARIWEIYLNRYGLDPQQSRPSTHQWTGAEIKTCCRLAALLNIPLKDAAQNVVPVAVTAEESVAKLRHWANGRCLSADKPGIYSFRRGTSKRRKVNTDPSAN